MLTSHSIISVMTNSDLGLGNSLLSDAHLKSNDSRRPTMLLKKHTRSPSHRFSMVFLYGCHFEVSPILGQTHLSYRFISYITPSHLCELCFNRISTGLSGVGKTGSEVQLLYRSYPFLDEHFLQGSQLVLTCFNMF